MNAIRAFDPFGLFTTIAVGLFGDETATTWVRVFLTAIGAFTVMYATFALATWLVVGRALPALGIGRRFDARSPAPGQVAAELRGSAVSILVFGGVALSTHALIVADVLDVRWDVPVAVVALEVVVLLLWNEVHFYGCHRLLHTPWLFRRVHLEHHRSVTVTPLAAFRFHWFEAVLLSTVMPLAMLAHDFSAWALFALPPASLALNMLGHANHDFAPEARVDSIAAFGRRHSLHHHRPNGNYGFFTPWMDRVCGTA